MLNEDIIELIAQAISTAMPLGILIGIIERLLQMVIRAATGKE